MTQNLPPDDDDSPDMSALYNTTELHTDDRGVITDAAGNGYIAARVNGELAYIRSAAASDALIRIADAVQTAEAGMADPLTSRVYLLEQLVAEVTAAIKSVTL